MDVSWQYEFKVCFLPGAGADTVNLGRCNRAVRKVAEAKKLEGKLEYQKL